MSLSLNFDEIIYKDIEDRANLLVMKKVEKMNPVRICYLYSHCTMDFLEECEIPEFGFVKQLVQDAMLTPYRGFNITFLSKKEKRSSDQETDFIDECVSSLQTNESDTIYTAYSIPIVRDHVYTTQIKDEVRIKMLSTYNTSKVDRNYDVLESLDTFSFSTILVLLVLVFFMVVVLFLSLSSQQLRKTSRRILHRRIQSMFLLVFGVTLRNFAYVTPRMKSIRSSRIVVTLLVILMFFVGFFYITMVKTDQVTVKAPRVWASYKDIEDDEEARPLLFKFSDAFHLFRNADHTSFRYKIWQKALKFGINETVLELKAPNYLKIINLVIKKKSAILAYTDIMQTLERNVHHELSGTDMRGFTAFDQHEPKIVRVHLVNDRFDTSSVKVISKRQMFVFEFGLWARNMMMVARHVSTNIISIITGKGKDFWTLRQYISDRVILGHPQILKLGIGCYAGVFLLLVLSYLLSFLILVVEHKSSSKITSFRHH